MAQISRFWDGTTLGDAVVAPYDAGTEFSEVMTAVAGASRFPDRGGVIETPVGTLDISVPAAGVVRVSSGEALVYGAWYRNDANVDHTIPAPAAAPRIDRIILRKSWTSQTVRQILLSGIEGGSAPVLTKTIGAAWDVPIAQISVAVGGAITITDQRVKLGIPDASVIFTDPIVRDTLFFGAKPAGSADAALSRFGPNVLRTDNVLLLNIGNFTATNPAGQGGWDNTRLRIREAGWEAISIYGDNGFGSNINFYHNVAGQGWRGVTLTARAQDLTPGAQRTMFSVMISPTGNNDPIQTYGIHVDGHYWHVSGAYVMGLGGGNLAPASANLLNLGNPTQRWGQLFTSWVTAYGSVSTESVVGLTGNLTLQGGPSASVVVNPPSTYFYPINSTVKSGHPSWPWADIWTNHISSYGDIVTNTVLRMHGSVGNIIAVANIQLSPGAGYIHPDGNATRSFGHPSLEWADIIARRLYSSAANPLLVEAGNGAVQIQARGSGSPVNLFTDTGQMQFQTGDGFAIFPLRHNTVHLGTAAVRWKEGWGQGGWNSNSTGRVKQNWSDLPEGQALAALRLMRFGRFEYKRGPGHEDEWGSLNRWSVGYIAEDTVEVTRLVGAEDLFVSKLGDTVEPQRTASAVGAAVQDLDKELHEVIAELRARIEELERGKVYVNGSV